MVETKPTKVKKVNFSDHPFWDFWGPIFLSISLYLGIRTYVAEARYIPSGSMLPGLQIQDRLVIEKLSYRRRSPYRGEIVVFKSPYSFDSFLSLRSKKLASSWQCTIVNLPLFSFIPGLSHPACDAYIKRVVALPGESVEVNNKGNVFINKIKLKEPYVTRFCSLENQCRRFKATVPKNHVLVLGDNRRNSWDGRFWPGGPFLPENQILGRAIWRFWPVDRIGLLR